MPEGLRLPSGESLPIDPAGPADTAVPDLAAAQREFARAMAADDPPEVSAPPRRDLATERPAPPSEKPKRGRPRRDATTPAANAAKSKTHEALPPKDYTAGLTGLTDGLWLATAMIPVPPGQIASVVIGSNRQALVASLNAAAQANAMVRQVVEFVAGDEGGGGFMALLGLGMVAVSMASQASTLARHPELLAQAIEANSKATEAYMSATFGVTAEAA